MDTIKPTMPDAERTAGSLHRDCSVRTCEVCGRPMTEKRYEHGEDKRTYWTCDLAEGAWAHGCQHTAEDAPENRKALSEKVSDGL